VKGKKVPYRWEDHTWPEIKELVDKQPVVLLTVGSTEDHGYHLPLDTDSYLLRTLCEEACARIADEVLLLPHVPYGFHDHHMEFPGGITVSPRRLEDFVVDITTSVARHGFKRILIGNGHGSNAPILEMAARRTILETKALCGSFSWWALAREHAEKMRESKFPGGMAHGGELETSLYLHLNPEAVYMDRAEPDYNVPVNKYFYLDLMGSGPLQIMEWWSRISKTGIIGDPTLGTAEKGRLIYEGTVEGLADMIRTFRGMDVGPGEDKH